MLLTNTNKMLKNAYENKYAIGAFNVNNMEIIQGIIDAAIEKNSPIILQVSPGAKKYARLDYIIKLVEAATANISIPVALHLDHGTDFETCKSCIDHGFSSVMIDGSQLSFNENIKLTYKVVNYAKTKNVSVEGELGQLCGIEDEIINLKHSYTSPDEVYDFVKQTGVDSLAVAIGTSHGFFKFQNKQKPHLRFDILDKIEEKLPNFPIVLHGASSISQIFIQKINKYNGNINNANGIPEEILKKAAQKSVCKINIDSDIRLAFTSSIREFFYNFPNKVDPRQYLGYARESVKKLVAHKIDFVLGSANKS